MNSFQQLTKQCESIANTITNPPLVTEGIVDTYSSAVLGAHLTARDFIADSFDTKFTISGDLQYLSGVVCIELGGPNIYIDTGSGTINGYWGSAVVRVPFIDTMDIDEALESQFITGIELCRMN